MSDSYVNLSRYAGENWKSPVATSSALPAVGNNQGDIRVALDNSSVWQWQGSAWAVYTAGGSSPANPGGFSSDIQYNNAGAFAGDGQFTYAGNGGTVNLAGLLKVSQIIGNTGIAGIVVGAGAGTGASVSFNGFDMGGLLEVTTGTELALNSTICILSYASNFGNSGVPVFSPASSSAAAEFQKVYMIGDNNGFSLQNGDTLGENTYYAWNVISFFTNGQ